MTAIAAEQLGKRYGRRWALRNCTVSIPEGHVVGLVGANGAGKSTFLHLAVGLLEPTEGTISVMGGRPGTDAADLAKIGFVAQEAPVYAGLTVAEHLHMGAGSTPPGTTTWRRGESTGSGSTSAGSAGKLSGGQRSQLALTLAMAKRPEVLVLDEPVSSLDPLARREFLQDLMTLVADQNPTVLLSSHLLADVERVCDYLLVLADGGVRIAGVVDDLLATHKVLTGRRRDPSTTPRDQRIIRATHTDRQTTLLVRTTEPVLDPRWAVSDVGLEELVLAYMSPPSPPPVAREIAGARP